MRLCRDLHVLMIGTLGLQRAKLHAGAEASPSPALAHRHATQPAAHGQHSSVHSRHSHSQTHKHPALPGARHAQQPPSSAARHDETQFFERVKHTLNHRETYNEFLRLTNLFTQDVMDSGRYIQEARLFLGDTGELINQLKEILGWDERRERFAGSEEVWTRPTGVLDRPSRNHLNIRYGSYRKLPANVSRVASRISSSVVDVYFFTGGQRRLLWEGRNVQVRVER